MKRLNFFPDLPTQGWQRTYYLILGVVLVLLGVASFTFKQPQPLTTVGLLVTGVGLLGRGVAAYMPVSQTRVAKTVWLLSNLVLYAGTVIIFVGIGMYVAMTFSGR